MLSATSPVGKNMGLGGFMYTDNVGPTRRTGAQLFLRLPLVADPTRQAINVRGVRVAAVPDRREQGTTFHDGGDPVMDDQLRGQVVPDATFGFLVYHDNWWVGATAPQLLHNNLFLQRE